MSPWIHKRKMTGARIAVSPAKADGAKAALVSWDLTLWPKPSAENAAVDEAPSQAPSQLDIFEEIVLPHLNAAYNLARWLTRNDQDAQDVVQESYLRALRFFD